MDNILPPFFIVGSGRSGTTLLRHLLNRHSLVCVPEETHFIPQLYQPFLHLHRQGKLQEAANLINSHPVIRAWHVTIRPDEIVFSDGEEAFAHAFHLVMSRKAALNEKPFWGEKTPRHLFYVPVLKRLFPEARFIHIYRDGRDVALSVMPLSWGPNNAYAVARWWVKSIRTWQQAQSNLLAGGGLDICYENFVQDPEAELQKICAFLELPYERGMLDGFTVHNNRTGSWKNKFYMSHKERSAFEAVAGDVLQELGYEMSVENPHVSLWLAIFSTFDDGYKRVSNRLLRI